MKIKIENILKWVIMFIVTLCSIVSKAQFVANAGVDQTITLPTTQCTISGSASGSIYLPIKYTHAKISGSKFGKISNPNSQTTLVTGLVAGIYKFKLTATDRRGHKAFDTVIITVTSAPPPPSNCNVASPVTYVITSSGFPPNIFIPTPDPSWKGGDTLKIPAGNYNDVIEFDHLHGDSCRPIIVINSGGLVYAGQIRFKNDCANVRVTGTGTVGLKYGIKSNGGPLTMNYGNHIEFDHIECTNPSGGVGMFMSLVPDTTIPITVYHKDSTNNYSINKITIHDCYVHNTLGEGMYVGNTAPDGDDNDGHYPDGSFILPLRMDSVWVYNNIVDSTGWDGIQLSNARDNCLIHDNKVTHFGLINMGSQQAGIIMGSNTTGVVYNDTVINGTGNGIQLFGYSAVNCYNNYVDSAGRDGTMVGQESVLSNDQLTTSQPTPQQQLFIYNNNIRHPQTKGAVFLYNDYNNSLPSSVHNNQFCIPSAPVNWQNIYIIMNTSGSTQTFNTLNCP